jgi:hypothetical protein
MEVEGPQARQQEGPPVITVQPEALDLSNLRALRWVASNGMHGSFVCRSACKTMDHNSYGECLRAAHIGVGKGESAPAQFA